MDKVHNLIIIGSGPAGLTAAIYSARARLEPLLFAGVTYGGQLMTTTLVENYPGFPEGVEGPLLINKMIEQVEKFGAQIVYESVDSVDFSKQPLVVRVGKNEYLAISVILATGANPKRLGLPVENKFWGKGLSTCATCDGAFFKDKKVAVIGGGDSAMEEANFLTKFANQVYIIHRRDSFRASQIMQERVLNNPRIEVVWNTRVKDLLGEKTIEKIKIFNEQTQAENFLEVDGVFLAIGHEPQTNFLTGQVELDEKGFVKVRNEVETNVPGVFVAGDASDPIYRQAITASGAGCKAAIQAQKYLAEGH